MIVRSVPGSLVELLKPVEKTARQWNLFPKHYEDLRQMSDIGQLLTQIRRMYQQEKKICSRLLEQGAKGEYYLATELQVRLHQQEGYLFNNTKITLNHELVGGLGTTAFPDHLIVTPHCFLYVETKNWNKEYFSRNEPEKKKETAWQMRETRKRIVDYLKDRHIRTVPELFLYDHAVTFHRRLENIPVIESPQEIVDVITAARSGSPLDKYAEIVQAFGG